MNNFFHFHFMHATTVKGLAKLFSNAMNVYMDVYMNVYVWLCMFAFRFT